MLTCVALLITMAVSASSPYADPGDEILRHDLEMLSDRGLINIPLTSWPLMWADIGAALLRINDEMLGDPAVSLVVLRLRQRVLDETRVETLEPEYRMSVYDNSRGIRTFENTPRSRLEIEGEISIVTNRFASRLRLAVVGGASDDRTIRPDGTYIAHIFGNMAVSLGWQEKWWGPGWGGTLGLSTNARPVPGLLVQRNFSDPIQFPLLKWLGPMSYQLTMGRKESDRGVPNPYLVGTRINFKPVPSLELGVSRTAQWGGEGRSESFDSFINMLIGRDNQGDDGIDRASEPGNQLAGFDARWRVLGGQWPVAFYTQVMGEDEAGGFPSRYLGQFGISTSGVVGRFGSYLSLRLEYSDTTCQFNESSKIFNCAYNNSNFSTGYRYRGRSIGHSTDNDASQTLLNAQWINAENRRYSMMVRVARLNRGGVEDPTNSLTPTPRDFANIEFSHERPFRQGTLSVGFGADRTEDPETGADDDTFRVFVQWSRPVF